MTLMAIKSHKTFMWIPLYFVYMWKFVFQYVPQESNSNQVVFMQLDLGSLKSVRSFAENFLKSESRLDILINNAG